VRIVLAADHAGYDLKEHIKQRLKRAGHEVVDVGTDSAEAADYSDFGHPAACMVAKGEVDRGIFCCGSGAGMSITANRIHGVRAVVGFTTEIARLARAHNDANVLCLAARLIENEPAWQITQTFLIEPFEGGRHLRRIEKIEKGSSCNG
jgi:ribose 5-phosphate isomerase B